MTKSYFLTSKGGHIVNPENVLTLPRVSNVLNHMCLKVVRVVTRKFAHNIYDHPIAFMRRSFGHLSNHGKLCLRDVSNCRNRDPVGDESWDIHEILLRVVA